MSYGREEDGQAPWVNFTVPTPDATNHIDGIQELNVQAIHAWPSITSDQIVVSMPFTGQVISSTGAVMMQIRKATRIDVSSLSEGSYMLRANDGRSFRFVKVD